MPGPRLSMNFAIVDESSSGAINWSCAVPPCRRHGQHRLADSLVVVDFLMHQDHAEVVVVPGDRGVEVGDRDADVIEAGHQGGGQQRDGRQLDRSSSHNGNVAAKIALLREAESTVLRMA